MNHQAVRERAFRIIDAYKRGFSAKEIAADESMPVPQVYYALNTYSRGKLAELRKANRANGKRLRRYERAKVLYECGMSWDQIAVEMEYANAKSCRRAIQYAASRGGLPVVSNWERLHND